jgi:hypothetical protein
MMRITGKAVASKFGVYLGASLLCVLEFLAPSAIALVWAAIHTSSTTTPAPSPMTKPPLSLSNGRLASVGQSFQFVAKLLALANPEMASGCMHDSAPPATMTSASPN